MASKLREMIVPIYSAFMGPYIEYCIQVWGTQHKKDLLVYPGKGQRNYNRT